MLFQTVCSGRTVIRVDQLETAVRSLACAISVEQELLANSKSGLTNSEGVNLSSDLFDHVRRAALAQLFQGIRLATGVAALPAVHQFVDFIAFRHCWNSLQALQPLE